MGTKRVQSKSISRGDVGSVLTANGFVLFHTGSDSLLFNREVPGGFQIQVSAHEDATVGWLCEISVSTCESSGQLSWRASINGYQQEIVPLADLPTRVAFLADAVTRAKSSPCPHCYSEMVLKKRKVDGGAFFGCSRYPECKGTRDTNEVVSDAERRVAVLRQLTPNAPNVARVCRCGAPMVRRRAKKGHYTGKFFWGCSTYPKCKYLYVDGLTDG